MSTFVRGSHYRTSKKGKVYPVRAASVTRDRWHRITLADRARLLRFLDKLNVTGSATARFIAPTRCPICGAPVYFYQNEHGARVYFEELGPPWPKHPCTDLPQAQRKNFKTKPMRPSAREGAEVATIRASEEQLGYQPDDDFAATYGSPRWPAFKVNERLKTASGMWLILTRIDGISSSPIFLFRHGWPACLRSNEVVFVRGRTLAYLNPRGLVPKELTGERVQSARAFVKRLLTASAEG